MHQFAKMIAVIIYHTHMLIEKILQESWIKKNEIMQKAKVPPPKLFMKIESRFAKSCETRQPFFLSHTSFSSVFLPVPVPLC